MDLTKILRLNNEFSIDELVEHAAQMIQLFVPKQERYKVTDYPDVRTVRFYTTRGLMDKPHRYSGQQAVYRVKHLIQLIVIKYLQSQYLSIKKVAEMINGLSQEELLIIIDLPKKGDFKSAYLEPVSQNKKPSSRKSLKVKKIRNSISELVWNHFTIESGFEVHIREDFFPENPSHVEVLANRIRVILKQINGGKEDTLCQ
ncbi:MAG: MerR family transcriptional regulator [Deltaproteobacteria bacterium]|nr:MerR family transcriptional regulator [Deltaproteobacteria bacterium]MBW1736046.1 MerR family transcriptional regulator [Deltaproteobacteria bacterium]MBW2032545.1 MerR family transcriptional regulator [Deltaproteobacteria bacterium]MBW2113672.1 MerR family transcriptional regulator [Deltaproteobacteria bacterium]MBW2167933.1 MerR family transcriptional regulator [Deltaproteobacteria bacterium]